MKNNKRETNKMWGGRFSDSMADIMSRINNSIAFDQRLVYEDIEGSVAHAQTLYKAGIITSEELSSIEWGLGEIKKLASTDKIQWDEDLEDIHMNIEHKLQGLIGDVAKRIHTGRSRNDQVATDFRLWLRRCLGGLREEMTLLLEVLIDKAESQYDTLMPGFTHMQPAQPISCGHYFLAYVELFSRDRGRLEDANWRLNECPLGAAALAGTSFAIDRHFTSSLLGFRGPMHNSIDAIASRDFVLEVLSMMSICSVNMSRLAEELVLFTSPAYNFFTFSDRFSTGSSIMPQKRNPDAAELIRGQCGSISGAFFSMLMTLKALPYSYHKDLQQDKPTLFSAYEQFSLCLRVLTQLIQDISINKKSMREALIHGYPTATDLADWLVKRCKTPFRQAHHEAARIVSIAQERGVLLHELPLDIMQKVNKDITKELYEVLSVEGSVYSRNSYGGTSPVQVKKAVSRARQRHLKPSADPSSDPNADPNADPSADPSADPNAEPI